VSRILVSGAAGLVGSGVLRQLLASDPDVEVVALDRVALPATAPRLVPVRLDVLRASLGSAFEGVDLVIHLAEAGREGDAAAAMVDIGGRVLDAAAEAGVAHVVLLSSAMVYGAWPDNPVPLTEAAPLRPVPEVDFAVRKVELESVADRWRAGGARTLTTLRPTTALSERGASWVARSLRAATAVRPDQVDPPVQFLHVADLAAAVVLAGRRRLDGPYNVAPDGWLGPERLAALEAGVRLRLPDAVADAVVRSRNRVGLRPLPAGILAYVRNPWVVANDRLRAEGWVAAFSNEEAFIAGTPAPPWAVVSPKRRQELALGLAGAAALGLAGGALGIVRRLTR
jgi:nucleoside-diphosphate-sugar epimerase